MTQGPRSAAASLYPHLPSAEPEPPPRQQRRGPRLADALYPSLAPKPQPAPNRYRESEVSLTQRCDENPWLEHGLAMSGLIRKR
jgi:hypothetical protein